MVWILLVATKVHVLGTIPQGSRMEGSRPNGRSLGPLEVCPMQPLPMLPNGTLVDIVIGD